MFEEIRTSVKVHIGVDNRVSSCVTALASFYTLQIIVEEPDGIGHFDTTLFVDEEAVDAACANIIVGLRAFLEKRLDAHVRLDLEDDSIEGLPCV